MLTRETAGVGFSADTIKLPTTPRTTPASTKKSYHTRLYDSRLSSSS
jgi:hypothetical protein